MPCFSLHDLADAVDTTLGVDERAVLFEERCSRQEDVSERRRLVQEQVLHDEDVQRPERVLDVMVSGSDCAMSSPWMNMPRNDPSTAASNMFGMRRPGSSSSLMFHSFS